MLGVAGREPLLPWQRWAIKQALTAGQGPPGHKITAMLVRGHERIWCSCGTDIPFDRDGGLYEASRTAIRRHLDEAAGLN